MTDTTDDPLMRLQNAAIRQDAEQRADAAVKKARSQLLLGNDRPKSNKGPDGTSVFFSTLALKLDTVPDWGVETACTNGEEFRYNPDWFLSLSEPQRMGTFAHEVMHLAMKHHARMGHRLLKRWNMACDLAVNPLILEAGYVLPPGVLLPGKGDHKDMPEGLSAEEYYARMQDEGGEGGGEGGDEEGDGQGEGGQGPGKGGGQGQDPGGCGGVAPPGDGSEAAARQSDAEWGDAVAQAHAAGKARGQMSAGVDRMVGEVLEPVVNWRDVLREFISRVAKNDYRWSPPNRRLAHLGYHLPSMYSEELGDVAIAFDTSGSITPEVIQMFASEIEGIVSAYHAALTIIYHDSAVCHVQRWTTTDGPLQLELKGGGGTDHCPVFDWIEAQGEPPSCLVCLTDLYSSFPDRAPDYPVLWASTTKGSKGPFGQTVEVLR